MPWNPHGHKVSESSAAWAAYARKLIAERSPEAGKAMQEARHDPDAVQRRRAARQVAEARSVRVALGDPHDRPQDDPQDYPEADLGDNPFIAG
jgi:hypothetical protein